MNKLQKSFEKIQQLNNQKELLVKKIDEESHNINFKSNDEILEIMHNGATSSIFIFIKPISKNEPVRIPLEYLPEIRDWLNGLFEPMDRE